MGAALSLRWKAFLLSLTVLAFVHAGLAYNGYVNLRQQYENAGIEEFARHRAMLDELFNQAAGSAEEQARALAAVASIEELSWVGELFFGFNGVRYYGEDGRQRAEWRLAGLPPNPSGDAHEQAVLEAVIGSGAGHSIVECSDGCLLRVVAPAFERGGRKVFVAASYPLSATLRGSCASAGRKSCCSPTAAQAARACGDARRPRSPIPNGSGRCCSSSTPCRLRLPASARSSPAAARWR